MQEYTFNNWVNSPNSSYYLGFDDNATKESTAQFSLSDDVYTRSSIKIAWFNEGAAEDQIAPRTFRFGSSYYAWVTTTQPSGTFVGWGGSDNWKVHHWTVDDVDGATFNNQDLRWSVEGSTRENPVLPDDLIINLEEPALSRMAGSHFATANTFVYGESDAGRKRRLYLLGYI